MLPVETRCSGNEARERERRRARESERCKCKLVKGGFDRQSDNTAKENIKQKQIMKTENKLQKCIKRSMSSRGENHLLA